MILPERPGAGRISLTAQALQGKACYELDTEKKGVVCG